MPCTRSAAAGELQQRVVEIETLIPSKSNRGEIIRSVNRGTGVARNKMRDKRAGGRATANCAARRDAMRRGCVRRGVRGLPPSPGRHHLERDAAPPLLLLLLYDDIQ